MEESPDNNTATLSRTGAAEVKAIVERARSAQREWASISVKERCRVLSSVRAFLLENIDGIAEGISRDCGKTALDALAAELVPAVAAAGYYCKMAPRFLKPECPGTGTVLFYNKRTRIFREPYGVIGIISPWNYPFSIPFSEVLTALLAGNAVILKTASATQITGNMLKETIKSASLPTGLFNYVNMPGPEAGDAFLDGGVDKLLFTGSVEAGKYLSRKAADTLTPLSLELGGNDPMIVCSDADIETAAAGAVWAGFHNAGQSCGAVERVYVHSEIYREFLEALKRRTDTICAGSGAACDIGPVASTKQADSVKGILDDALSKGASVYAESASDGTELAVPCRVLINVDSGMRVMNEEIFGPVIAVVPYEKEEEAVEMANRSLLGLTASVWTSERRTAQRISRKLNSGTVTVNDHLMSHGIPSVPWGGIRHSGSGRTHGKEGFMEVTRTRVVVEDVRAAGRMNFWWYPGGQVVYEGLKGALDFLFGRSVPARLKGLKLMLRAMRRKF